MGGIWSEPEERLRKEFDIPPDMSPMQYLLARMRAPETDEHVRTKIAIALLPFTVPKLQATATISLGQDFATRLERALMRSAQARVMAQAKPIEPKPKPPPVKPPLPTVTDRRFRRI
jgi:hypothetical protein